MKHFFTLLLVLAVAVPALRAAAPLPPGVVRVSDRIEEAMVSDSAPDLMTPMADDNVTYTDWEDLGMASWDDDTWYSIRYKGAGEENHFMIQKRSMIDNSEIFQLKLVGVFGGTDFIINGNTRTYECWASRQSSMLDCSNVENADLEHYDVGIAKFEFNFNSISLAGGRILFDLALYPYNVGNERFYTKSACLVTLDDAPQFTYSVEGRHVFGKDETMADITVRTSGDIDHLKYFVTYQNTIPTPAVIFNDYADRLQTTADSTITLPLETGCWEACLLPCDAEGRWLGANIVGDYIISYIAHAFHSNRADSYEWEPYGEVTVREGVLHDFGVYIGTAPSHFKCKLLTRKDAPGKILRLVNPYGPQSPIGSEFLKYDSWRFELPDEEFYIDINLENREKAYIYNRPIGLENHVDHYSYHSDGWLPVGTQVYPTYARMMSGIDTYYATLKWNRLRPFYNSWFEIIFAEDLHIQDNTIGGNSTLTLESDEGVDYVKYTFTNSYDAGEDIADKIANGDASITVYTASVNEPGSRTAGRTVTIQVPSDIDINEYTTRLIAVPYNAQDQLTGTYLESYMEPVWHNIGEAVIDGYLTDDAVQMKPSVQCERYASSMKFRLVKPSDLAGASEYFYIDATDPDNVNLSSDGYQGDYHTGVYFPGYSQNIDFYINTKVNFAKQGLLSSSMHYTTPVLNDRTVTIDDNSMLLIAYDANDAGPYAYGFDSSTITLPEFTHTSAVDTVITDKTVEIDENAPVEYYNLQGVKIANPGPGLYIRVQGSKAEKILIR